MFNPTPCGVPSDLREASRLEEDGSEPDKVALAQHFDRFEPEEVGQVFAMYEMRCACERRRPLLLERLWRVACDLQLAGCNRLSTCCSDFNCSS